MDTRVSIPPEESASPPARRRFWHFLRNRELFPLTFPPIFFSSVFFGTFSMLTFFRGGQGSIKEKQLVIGDETMTSSAWLSEWARPLGADIDAGTGLPRQVKRIRDGANMSLVPAGQFVMGAPLEHIFMKRDASPARQITLTRPYYMDVTEVTIGQWKTYLLDSGNSVEMIEDYFSRKVSKEDYDDLKPFTSEGVPKILGFLSWVGKAELPTEAQWERAARGGIRENAAFPWGSATNDFAQRCNGLKSPSQPPPVLDRVGPNRIGGPFPPNAFGLYDMAGNVEETVNNAYDPDYYSYMEASDPVPTTTPPGYVHRGGAWFSEMRDLTVFSRGSANSPPDRWDKSGFRCAKTVPPAAAPASSSSELIWKLIWSFAVGVAGTIAAIRVLKARRERARGAGAAQSLGAGGS